MTLATEQDARPYTSREIKCFVCGDTIDAATDEKLAHEVHRLARQSIGFLVCAKCFDAMLTDEVRNKRVVLSS